MDGLGVSGMKAGEDVQENLRRQVDTVMFLYI
jgi:hypothetical protein